ncbi:putative multiple sugar transport system permease protein [Propionispira arboris]|jgi:putative multiple sugar transport system permease protein|uniref:Xylose transport system permease protein XylH n=1 Tax=Propionispira arboris TaxID=84035 RepID=A0A1H7BZL7_9FIRM|nr:multiple monosaccharide ABC transporter permease [Propionispira arboris]SEJ78785.1 putative multiple sugar transport system permease protein [Propionispira arboris]
MSNETTMNQKKLAMANLKQYGMMIALFVIYVIFLILSDGKNAAPMNINNLVMQNSYVVILSIGMLLCCLTANVDLAVGSIVAFCGAAAAIMVLDYHIAVPVTFAIVLLIGILVGMWQGFFIAVLKVPPFIVTLANMLVFRGLTMVILNGQTKGPLPQDFTQVGAGYLPQIFMQVGGTKIEILALIGGLLASVVLVLLEIRSRRNKLKHNFVVAPMWQVVAKLVVIIGVLNFITAKLALYMGLPLVLLIMLALIIIYSFITNDTVAGRQVYAVGGNVNAARLSGINTDKVMFWVYTNMGLLAALAGIVLAARNASATPKAGDTFELDAIAACYIGGAAVQGGSGTITGAVIGALVMGILNNGMSLIGWSVDIQRVVKGLVLLAAVTFDLYNKRKSA